MISVIKTQETREGVNFRLYIDNEFKFIHKKFNNYFYIKNIDYEDEKETFHKKFTFCIEKVSHIGKFTKIYLSNNFMRFKVKGWWEDLNCQTYEADIKANKRYLLDNDIPLNNDAMPYAFFDIETDDRLPLQKDKYGNVEPQSRILSYSRVDNNGKFIYFELENETDDAEIILLQNIIKDLSNYGIISGWYSERFDMPYIKGRCDTLNINYDVLEYVNHLDYKEVFTKYDKKSRPSTSLNAISNEILNESKIDQEKGNGAIYNTWLNDKEHLKKYNIEDSNLIYKINKKIMFIEIAMTAANLNKCHVRNTMNNTDSGDFLLLRAYKKAGIIMTSKPTKAELKERKKLGKIGGGYTTCFNPGFYEKADVWDFASLYPSIIEKWNIDPMTFVSTIEPLSVKDVDLNKFIVTPDDFENYHHRNRIYKKEKGVIPTVVNELTKERNKTKYEMNKYKWEKLENGDKNPDYNPVKYKQLYLLQYAIKTVNNSIYGTLGFPASRYYSWEVADSVTTCARATIKECYKKLEEWGCLPLGGDTDSTFVDLKGHDYKEIDKKFIEFLEVWAKKWGTPYKRLIFEHEKVYKPFLFVKKKNYAYIDHDKVKIVGMEAIKSDTNPKAAEIQKQLIEDILYKRVDMDHWEDKIEELYNECYNQELKSSELVLTKALTKMPAEYDGYVIDKKTGKPKIKADGTLQKKSKLAHVKLAERLISQGVDIYPGSKMHFIVIKTKPNLAISLEEYSKGEGVFITKHKKIEEFEYHWEGDYDAAYYWERIMTPFIKVIFVYNKSLPEWHWGLTNSVMNKIMRKLE